ncbi:hypothetical protein OGAPHI_006179 [Ogataea philodendri]|uniref:PH-like domain-containing protein n=1 Tax=Ogataea philodendri TaxID=1378263 RepID=A0A9P8T0Q0_9ASCO|nr:uncharacterized protein OGAPHI_006179 [Ogataea philodendri]KAH3661998.1 hypothetical protein OGAPHI_006179 [Ogataea philodendri]
MNSPVDIEQVLDQIRTSDSHYRNELGSLLRLVNAFDSRYNNYFDDKIDDDFDELVDHRQAMNTKLTKVVRLLIVSHKDLGSILEQKDLMELAANFARWCISANKGYRQYVELYRIRDNQSLSEVELRRQPLLRLAYLHQSVKTVKNLLSLQIEHSKGGTVFSDLEIALHRLGQLIEEARKMDQVQRKKLDNHVNFANVRSITDFAMVCSSFNVNAMVDRYETEMYYTNEKLDVSLIYKTMELVFLKNNTVAMVSVEKGHRALLFPPLRANELQYDKQVEEEVYLFRHTLDKGICIYLKLDGDIADKLLSFWKKNVQLTKTRSMGMGILIQKTKSDPQSDVVSEHEVREVKAYRRDHNVPPRSLPKSTSKPDTKMPLQAVSDSQLNMFDAQKFAQNYQHGIDGSYLKKKRQSVFGMLSNIIKKKQPVNEQKVPEVENLLANSTHTFLQRVQWCHWKESRWSQPVTVDLLLLQTSTETFLFGTRIESDLGTEFLVKLNDSTIVRRSSETVIHITSSDLQSTVTLFRLTTESSVNANQLSEILKTRSTAISNSSSQSSGLSTGTGNASFKTFITSTSTASNTFK